MYPLIFNNLNPRYRVFIPAIRFAVCRHGRRRLPTAGILIQHPACVGLRRDERITLAVVGVTNASKVLALVAVIAGLQPSTAEQVAAEIRALRLLLDAVSIKQLVVVNHDDTQHRVVQSDFSKVCHLVSS